jgi:hypothetical protein
MKDMAVIIGEGYYWKKSNRPQIDIGTLMIAMGSHGGRGLYLVGIVTGEWEREDDAGSYHHRIPVQWQPLIYMHDVNSVDAVANMISGFNYRFGAECSQTEFRKVLDFVLTGRIAYPRSVAAA